MSEVVMPSSGLIEQLDQSEIDYMSDRMRAIQSRPGNPEGIEVQRFGSVVCLYSRTMPWGQFNAVKGLRDSNIEQLDEIVAFYRSRERAAQFDIVPSLAGAPVLQRLAELGYYQSGFHTSLYACPSECPPVATGAVALRELRADEFEQYAEIHCRGFGMPDSGIPHVAANNRVLFGRPGWKFYLALVDDVPAAAAVMYIKDKAASFTFAATLPAYRQQGVHQQLIRARLAEAAGQGCDLAVGQCAIASQSHRNMERLGMRIGYVKALWTPKPS